MRRIFWKLAKKTYEKYVKKFPRVSKNIHEEYV